MPLFLGPHCASPAKSRPVARGGVPGCVRMTRRNRVRVSRNAMHVRIAVCLLLPASAECARWSFFPNRLTRRRSVIVVRSSSSEVTRSPCATFFLPTASRHHSRHNKELQLSFGMRWKPPRRASPYSSFRGSTETALRTARKRGALPMSSHRINRIDLRRGGCYGPVAC
jgi:hypothetical protein